MIRAGGVDRVGRRCEKLVVAPVRMEIERHGVRYIVPLRLEAGLVPHCGRKLVFNSPSLFRPHDVKILRGIFLLTFSVLLC